MMEQKTSNTNIKVAIRIRPLIPSEKENKLRIQWATQQNIVYQIDEKGQKFGEAYSFDHIFGIEKTNTDIYNDIVKDFVVSSLDGLNSTIFAYGQTSSGKTYTMSGNKKDIGVMSLAIENIFNAIEQNTNRKFLIRVSYIEIYNEKINDLLDPENKDVKIRELYPATIVMQNVKEEIVSSRQEMYEYLKRGNVNRHIGSTKANDRSSRSHTIFKIMIESTHADEIDNDSAAVQVSNLNLVDLAGSERVAQTKATGMRLKEGGHINKSLSALGLVIKQLSDGQEFVNFRDSKLTRLLQDSLGGNSKTLIIATITLVSVEDTASTLAFAQRAKTVKNKPQVNEILSDADVSKRYAALNAQLQKKLDEQVVINQRLRRIQEENSKEMLRLQQQKDQLEDFQSRKRTPKSKAIPRRRHTIGFSAQKQLFRLPIEDSEKAREDPNDVSFEKFHNSDLSFNMNAKEGLEPILEEEDFASIGNKDTTPENFLRMRLSCLEQDYNELVTYTRDEENILNETSKMVDELQQQLSVAQLKMQEMENRNKLEKDMEEKFLIREQELTAKISELEEKLAEKYENSSISNDDIIGIMKQLVHLQDVLSSPEFVNDLGDTKDKEDSVLHIIEAFNSKVKTSKEIIECEIIKQINNFNHFNKTNHERFSLPNELSSFNHLLNELSLFESDIPVDLINSMKKEGIEDLKLLIKVYESLLKKNEFIGMCSEKIKFLEENKEILKKCADLEEQLENLNEVISKNESEKQVFLEELERFKILISSQSEESNKLSKEINEKNSIIDECRSNYTKLNDEKLTLHQKYLCICDDLEQLKEENEHMKINKNSLLDQNEELEQKMKILLTEKNEAIEEKDKILEILKSEKEKLYNENELLKDEMRDRLHGDNEKVSILHEEINNLKCEITQKEKLILELQEKHSDLPGAVETLEKNNVDLTLQNSNLQTEIERLKNSLNTCEDANDTLEQKLKSSELKIQRQKQLLNNLQTQVNDLKQALAQKESLASELLFYKCQLLDSNKKKDEYLKQNEQFQSQIKDLQSEMENLKDHVNDNTKSCEQEMKISDLNKMKEEMLAALCKIVDYFVNKHKSLLTVRHCQDQRDRFKSVVADLKTNNTILKNLLNLLMTENCDLDTLSDTIIKCESTFKEYFNLEKRLLNEQIEQLEFSNKAYLEEIMSLKDSKENINTTACPHCDNMKSQLASLGKENIDRMKQIVDLQTKIYEEQDKKAEIQYSEWLKFCRETDKIQQQQIRKLQQQIERYKLSAKANKNSAEIQCDLLQEDPARQEKYNVMKNVCLKRKEEIAALKWELGKLKRSSQGSTNSNQEEDKKEKENTIDVSIQCDILDSQRYFLMKKVCINRKEEIAVLKKQLASLRGTQ